MMSTAECVFRYDDKELNEIALEIQRDTGSREIYFVFFPSGIWEDEIAGARIAIKVPETACMADANETLAKKIYRMRRGYELPDWISGKHPFAFIHVEHADAKKEIEQVRAYNVQLTDANVALQDSLVALTAQRDREHDAYRAQKPLVLEEFATHMLDDDGIARCNAVAEVFSAALTQLRELVPTTAARDRAILVTKLQEACHVAKRGIACDPYFQRPVAPAKESP